MGMKRGSPVNKVYGWVRRQSKKVQTFLAITSLISTLALLNLVTREYEHLYIASEAVHFLGLTLLIHKLYNHKSCSGLSLKTQEVTAIWLAARIYCSFFLETDIHTALDCVTLVSTSWVIYMMRFKLKSTYIEELDNMPIYYTLVPCAVLAILIHPHADMLLLNRILWAFNVYLESISVLPQLRLIQNAKMVEPFTAHYIFALGVARFLACAHWIIRAYDSTSIYVYMIGSGHLWLPMVLVAEIVQTFILADFCYYYVKSVMNGQLVVTVPSV